METLEERKARIRSTRNERQSLELNGRVEGPRRLKTFLILLFLLCLGAACFMTSVVMAGL